jgi:hypothetical protein
MQSKAIKTRGKGKLVPLTDNPAIRALAKIREEGRPLHFSDELSNLICENIRQGVTLQEISEQPGMPSARTIMEWQRQYPAFYAQITLAREFYADYCAKMALNCALDDKSDKITVENGRIISDRENVLRSKLKFEAFRWQAKVHAPRKYGEKLEITQETAPEQVTPAGQLSKFRDIIQKQYIERGGSIPEMIEYLFGVKVRIIGEIEVKETT